MSNDGAEYFVLAHQILSTHYDAALTSDMLFPAALLYASIYAANVNRPLDSWRLAHRAAVNLQMQVYQYHNLEHLQLSNGQSPLVTTPDSIREGIRPSDKDSSIHQLCWTAFLLER